MSDLLRCDGPLLSDLNVQNDLGFSPSIVTVRTCMVKEDHVFSSQDVLDAAYASQDGSDGGRSAQPLLLLAWSMPHKSCT